MLTFITVILRKMHIEGSKVMYSRKRVTCIGGGTGMSTMLRGLKEYTEELAAIVTVADNGGHSGFLRREMNMLPPGDIRNCLMALATTEPMMEDVFQYRFPDGVLKGQNIGNLFLAALTDICGSFESAVEKANQILAVKGQVLPVTMEDVELKAVYEDHSMVIGEHEIVATNKTTRKKIEEVSLIPNNPPAYDKAIQAILKADLIILGPGSLYTSIIPNLLVDGVSEAIRKSYATVVYVGNIMTQPGETDNYTLNMHLKAIERYLGEGVIKYVVSNNTTIDPAVEAHYKEDHQVLVVNDVKSNGITVVEADFAIINDTNRYVRHNAKKIAEVVIGL